MRPVERGDCPADESGNPKVFDEYQDSRADLIACIGPFCSYCERRMDASLAVEHVKPKVAHPSALLNWDNFLLACVNCNSTKGKKSASADDCYFPHVDNTFRAFSYENGIIEPHLSLTKDERNKAIRTMKLTGLDKTPRSDPQVKDRRWLNRLEVWNVAVEAKADLQDNDTPEMRRQIIRVAFGRGFWSIWMTVFADDPDMLRRLIEGFPGTAASCFDATYACVPRPGGAL